MKEFLINYFASVASGLTLSVIGSLIYFKILKNKNVQKNSNGDNNVFNINEINVSSTKKESSKIINNK
jgi:hypothetical protein